MNELLCGNGRQGKPTALAHHPRANTSSKHDPKHYPKTWARIGTEAGRISQLELRVTRTALISARTSAVDARLARVQAEIELARQDGRAPFQGAQ